MLSAFLIAHVFDLIDKSVLGTNVKRDTECHQQGKCPVEVSPRPSDSILQQIPYPVRGSDTFNSSSPPVISVNSDESIGQT